MTLRAGAAAIDISPAGPVQLCGYPHVARLATGIHDQLHASALFLERDDMKAMLISLELALLDPVMARTVRRLVAQAVKIPESAVLISCTHTHSGPVTARLLGWTGDVGAPPPDARYLDLVCQRTVEAAVKAQKEAMSAEYVWTTADAQGVGGNRLSPAGVTDPEVGILAVRRAGAGPWCAIVLVHGMHPTVLHQDSTLVSADFPYYAALQLQETYRTQPPVVLYHMGPSGNQSPRHFVKAQTFAEAERLGRKLGNAVSEAIKKLPPNAFTPYPILRGCLTAVSLPRRKLPAIEEAERLVVTAKSTLTRLKVDGADRAQQRTAECAVFGAEGTVALAKLKKTGELDHAMGDYDPVEVQTLRIGEVCLAGLPGECFAEYGLTIKKNAVMKTHVVSLVNGDLQGYIVTPEAAAAGGYEAATGIFTPEAGTVLVRIAQEQIQMLTRTAQARPSAAATTGAVTAANPPAAGASAPGVAPAAATPPSNAPGSPPKK